MIAFLVASAFASATLGNPNAPQVKSGSATFATSGNTLTVTNSPGAIIHWQGFSIQQNEATRFQQQNAASAVLNRVVGQDPSQILGTLTSNGRVFLVNPNGIVFGAGARVDVQGLVASTLNIGDQDFLANKLNFQAGAVAGAVVNQGTITTPQGGQVYLIAPNVENHGIITSPKGEVILAAGKSVKLVDSANPNLRVEIQAGGNAVNIGQIIADGGKAGIYAGVIQQQGTVRANTVERDATGRIVFRASGNVTLAKGSVTQASGTQGGEVHVQSDTGTTLVAGRIEATGSEGKGGKISVLGEQVGLVDKAVVDASGATGGGTVLIGGDFQGKNPDVKNAKVIYVGPDVQVRADATQKGDGGKVIAWADDTARIHGAISARGGPLGGNGGFVETSGKRYLEATRAPDITAPAGNAGHWWLDPEDITIQNTVDINITAAPLFQPAAANTPSVLGNTTLEAALNNGGTVTIDTTVANGGGTGNGDVIFSAPVTKIGGASSTLAILANRNVSMGSTIQTTGNALTINVTADQDNNGTGNVSISAQIVTLGGGFTAIGQAVDIAANGNVQTGGGAITLTAKSTDGITLNAGTSRLESGGANVTLVTDTLNYSGGGGSIAAGAGAVRVQPYTLSRPVIIDSSGNGSALTLTPTILSSLSGARVEIGRTDGTGTLSTFYAINSTHLNAPVLKLAHGNVTIGAHIDFSSEGESLELQAKDLIKIGQPALNVGVTLGSGNLLVTGNGSATSTFRLEGSTGANMSGLAYAGNITVSNLNAIEIVAGSGNGATAELSASGTQSISIAGNLTLTGGSTNNDAFARLSAGGDQTVSVGGHIVATGGNGVNNYAEIWNTSSTGVLNTTVGGAVLLQGGTAGNTSARIHATNPGATNNITVVGNLHLQAGSGGSFNAPSRAYIGGATVNADVNGQLLVQGGSGQAARAHLGTLSNAAVVNINQNGGTGYVQLQAGSGDNALAYIGSKDGNATVNVKSGTGGALTITACSGSIADAFIGTDGGATSTITVEAAGQLTLQSSANGFAFVGAANGNSPSTITLKAGTTVAGGISLGNGEVVSSGGTVTLLANAPTATTVTQTTGMISAGNLVVHAQTGVNLPSANNSVSGSLEGGTITGNFAYLQGASIVVGANGVAAANGAVSLTASSGTISSGTGSVDITAGTGGINLTAWGVGTVGNPVTVDSAGAVNATTSCTGVGGDIYLGSSASLSKLGTVVTDGASQQTVSFNSSAQLAVTGQSSTNDAWTLAAGNGLDFQNNANTTIVANSVTLNVAGANIHSTGTATTDIDTAAGNGAIVFNGNAIGSSGAPIEVRANAAVGLTVQDGNGSVYLRQTQGDLATGWISMNRTSTPGGTISLATANGHVNVFDLSFFNGTADDHFVLTSGGAAKNIAFGSGLTVSASSLTLAGTGNVTFAGNTTFNTPVDATAIPMTIGGVTVTFNGDANLGALTTGGSTITGSGNISVTTLTKDGAVTQIDSTATGPFPTFNTSGQATISSERLRVANRTWNINGNLNITGSNSLLEVNGNGTVVNRPGSTVRLESEFFGINAIGGTGNFVNEGTLVNAYTAGTMDINVASFTNNGTVTFDAAANQPLYINSTGATDTGTYTIASGKQLYFNGNRTFGATSNVVNNGLLLFAGGTQTLQGTYTGGGNLSVTNGAINFNTTTGSASFPTITLTGGTLGGTNNLTVTSAMTWNTVIATSGLFTIASGATANLGISPEIHGATVRNDGTINWGDGTMWFGAGAGNATVDNYGTFNWSSTGTIQWVGSAAPTINNYGIFNFASSGTPYTEVGFRNHAGGTLNIVSGNFQHQGAAMSDFLQAGTLNISAGASLDRSLVGGFTNTGNIAGTGTLNLGTATLTNNGTVQPGGAGNIGTLSITGHYSQAANGTLAIDIASANSRDLLAVSGNATLGGTLAVTLGNYAPAGGDTHVVLTAANVTGTFASITGNGALAAQYNGANFTLGIFGKFWDGGGGDYNWFNNLNWTGDATPTAADDVILDFAGANVVTISTGASALARTLVSNESITLSSGALTLGAGNSSLASGATLTYSGGTFALDTSLGNSTLSLAAGATFNISNVVGFSSTGGNTGTLAIAAGANLNITNPNLVFSNVAVANAGVITANMAHNNSFSLNNGASITNNGTFRFINPAGTINFLGAGSGTASLVNQGVLEAVGGGNVQVYNGTGTLLVQHASNAVVQETSTGALFLGSGTHNYAAGVTFAGDNIRFTGGVHNLAAGSTMNAPLNVVGGTVNAAGLAINAGGTLTSGGLNLGAGTSTLAAGTTFNQSGATNLTLDTSLGNATLVLVAGATLNMSNGATILGTGGNTATVSIPAGANLNAGNTAGHVSLTGATVDNAGVITANMSSGWALLLSSGTTLNNSGTLRFVNPAGSFAYIYSNSGAATLSNTGTIEMAGAGRMQIYDGSGTVNLQNNGLLAETSTGNIGFGTGTYVHGAGASFAGDQILFDAGNHTFTAGSTMNAPWNLTGATANVRALTVTSTANYGLGTLNLDASAGNATLTLAAGATMNITSRDIFTVGGNAGTLAIAAGGNLNLLGSNINFGNVAVNNAGLVTANMVHNNSFSLNGGSVLTNTGTIRYLNPAGTTIYMQNSGGTGTLVNNGTFEMAGAGNMRIGGGSFTFDSGTGNLNVAAGNLQVMAGAYTNNGTISLAGGTSLSTTGNALVNAGGALIAGSGTINLGSATLTNNGVISPGGNGVVGILTLTGNYVQGATGTLAIDIPSANSRDVLAVTGTANLGGNLAVTLAYGPGVYDKHVFLTYQANGRTGTFANVTGNGALPLTFKDAAGQGILGFSGKAWDSGGGANTSWLQALNWDDNIVPTAADDVVIATATNSPVTLAGGSAFANTLVSNVSMTISGGTLNLSGGNSSFGAGTTLSITGGTLGGAGNMTVNGDFNWSGGAVANASTLSTTGNTVISGAVQLRDGRTWVNVGNATLGGSGTLALLNTATLNNALGGTFAVTSSAVTPITWSTGGNATIVNAGTINWNTPAQGHVSFLTFDNSGNVNVLGGNLALNSVNGTDAGLWTIAGGAVLRSTHTATSRTFVGGSDIAGSGSVQVDAGEFNVGNAYSIAGTGTTTVSGGTLNLSTGGPVTFSNILTVSSGTLNGTANVTVNGSLAWTGAIGGASTLTTAGNTTVSGASAQLRDGRTWVNQGNASVSGAGALLIVNNGSISNAPGATLAITSNAAAPIGWGSPGTASIVNAGTMLWNTPGVGQLSNLTFTNTGSVLVQGGTLSLVNGTPQVNDGVLAVGAGTTFRTNGTNFTNAANGTLTGVGTFNVGAGTLTNGGLVQPGGGGNVGTLTVIGNYAQTAGGTLSIDIPAANSRDVLAVTGTANLGGTLAANVGYAPGVLDKHVFLTTTANGITGNFGSVTGAGNLPLTIKSASGKAILGSSAIQWVNANSGSWFTAANWDENAVPTINDDVVIDVATNPTVSITAAASAKTLVANESLSLSAGSLTLGTGNSAINANVAWSVGTMFDGAGAANTNLAIGTNAGVTLSGGGVAHGRFRSLTVDNAGLITLSTSGGSEDLSIENGAVLNNNPGGVIRFAGTNQEITTWSGAGTLVNAAGTIETTHASAHSINGVTFNGGDGSINVAAGSLAVPGFTNNGLVSIAAGSTLSAGANPVTNAANGTITGSGTLSASTLTNAGNISVVAGTLQVPGFTSNGTVTIASGAVLATGGNPATNAVSGTIGGSGTLNLGGATLTNNGSINPGGMNAAGTLSVTGAVTMGPTSAVNVELAGNGGGQYDVLAVSGTATLGGNLNVTEISGFTVGGGDSYVPVIYGANAGTFALINAPAGASFTPTYNAGNLTLGISGVLNTWTFNGGGLWDLGTNWSRGHAPTATEDAVINEIAGNAAIVVSAAGQAAKSLLLGGTDDVLSVTGGSLALGANSTVTNYSQSGGAVTGAATATLTANTSFSQTGGTISGFDQVNATQASGTLVVNAVSANSVTLVGSSGPIVNAGNAATAITAMNANLVALGAGGIGDAAPITTAVTNLRFDSAGSNVRIANAGALNLGSTTPTSGGDVFLTAGGAITQSAPLSFSGNLSLNAPSVALGNPANNVGNTVSLATTGSANIAINNTLTLGATSVSGNLDAAAPDIVQGAAVFVAGTTTLNATAGAVTLTNAGNDFAVFAATAAGPVSVTDLSGINLGTISSGGGVAVVAAGAVTQSGSLSGNALSLSSVGGAYLGTGVNVPSLNLTNTGGGTTLINGTAPSMAVTGASSSGAGALQILNSGPLLVAGNVVNTGGDVALLSTGGAITVSGAVQASGAAGVQGQGATISGGSVQGAGGVAVNAGAGTLTNLGTITNGGGSAQVTLRGDNMALGGGSVNSGTGMLLLRTDNDAQPISLGAGATGLGLDNGELATLVGALQIGATSHAGGIFVDGPVARTTAASTAFYTNGGITIASDVAIAGGGSLSVIGGTVNVANGSVQAANIFLNGSGILVQPGLPATQNASVVAANDLSVNAGTMVLRGSDTTPGLGAKLQAGNAIVIGATSLSIVGGSAANAPASIDPLSVAIASTGNFVLQGGAGAGSSASVVGEKVSIAGANVQLLGGGGDGAHALVQSGLGGTTIGALAGGVIDLQAGIGLNANAGIVSLGAINAGTACATCAVLTANPYTPPTLSATGFYAANGVVFPAAAGGAGSGTTGGQVLDEVLVVLVNNAVKTVQLAAAPSGGEDGTASGEFGGTGGTGGKDDDDPKKKKNAPKCN